MKKIIYTLTILLLSISIVNAKCTVEKGTGKNIGDEIKCGTEEFYVISNDGTNLKMLAKYNLYAGGTADKVIFDKKFDSSYDSRNYYYEITTDENKIAIADLRNEDGEYYGVIEITRILTDEIKQDSRAIGAHGDLKVEPLFPEVGIYNVDLEPYNNFYINYIDPTIFDDEEESKIYEENYLDIEMNSKSQQDAELITYLKDYSSYLEKSNVTTKEISILSVKELNNIVKTVSNKDLPLKEWANSENWGEVSNQYFSFDIVGSIKDLMPSGYEWLWSTTYYTRTLAADSSAGRASLFFVDTMGDLCNSNYCRVSIGAGIRPVVTISSNEISYNIKTKTDGNGTLEATHTEAKNGEEIKFTPTPNEGYKIKLIKVTDETGKTVIYENNSFTMPESNVTIEVVFEKEVIEEPIVENPNTISISMFAALLFGIVSFIIVKVNYKKMKWLNE